MSSHTLPHSTFSQRTRPAPRWERGRRGLTQAIQRRQGGEGDLALEAVIVPAGILRSREARERKATGVASFHSNDEGARTRAVGFPPTTGDSQLQRLQLRQAAHVLAQRLAQPVACHVPPPQPPERPVELVGTARRLFYCRWVLDEVVRVRVLGARGGGARAARDAKPGTLLGGVQESRRPPTAGTDRHPVVAGVVVPEPPPF